MRQRVLWALALCAGSMAIGSGVAAQDAPVTPPATIADYSSLASLPDWTGVWQPDWSGLFGRPSTPPPVLTAAAKKSVDDFNARKTFGENLQGDAANCVPSGMPGIMRQPYPIEFIYSPGRVTILHETYSQVRRVFTDGRALPVDPDPAFNGSSVGHWEGDVLVVETSGLHPMTHVMEGLNPTDQTRIKERIHLTSPDLMTVDTEITDPALFLGKYQIKINYMRKRDWQIREYVCQENNRDGADEFGRPTMDLGN